MPPLEANRGGGGAECVKEGIMLLEQGKLQSRDLSFDSRKEEL